MNDFMVLVLANEAEEARLSPPQTRALLDAHSKWERALREANFLIDGDRLRPSGEGRRITARHGEARVDVGPFEAQPLVGFFLLRAQSLEAAVELAQKYPRSDATTLDVRPVMNGHFSAGRSSQPGRIFAFTVLGNAGTEPEWVSQMDAIDAATHDHFPPERFLGGARLHAPRTGKHVTSGRSAAVFDGPFLESKEVIGGLFFMRMTSLQEAVEWVSTTAFVKHGAIEVRELWRS